MGGWRVAPGTVLMYTVHVILVSCTSYHAECCAAAGCCNMILNIHALITIIRYTYVVSNIASPSASCCTCHFVTVVFGRRRVPRYSIAIIAPLALRSC
eukprot:1328507-Pleurochrysis_carterae.AAC.1